jgi:hypothetical protein
MKIIKSHPLICAILVTVAMAVACHMVGEYYAVREVREITQGAEPNDLRFDNVWIIGFGLSLIGTGAGIIAGLILGIIVYVRLRRYQRSVV